MSIESRAILEDIRLSARSTLETIESKPELRESLFHRMAAVSCKKDIGVIDYLLDDDIASFRHSIVLPGQARLDLFADPTSAGDGSEISLLVYQETLQALAGGAFALARQVAECALNRGDAGTRDVHSFDVDFARALFSIVCGFEASEQTRLIRKFHEACEQKRNAPFLGYADAFSAMVTQDDVSVSAALVKLAQGHEKLSKPRGLFDSVINRAICVQGVGVANLVRAHGLEVSGVEPLIPNDLLFSVTEAQAAFLANRNALS